jgi:aspartate-semialdehyde dehydrogenase
MPNIALFSAGGETSLEWAPKFAAVEPLLLIFFPGEWIQQKKLIVPEINAAELTKEDKIIANPNCSTIQMVLALFFAKKNTILREL